MPRLAATEAEYRRALPALRVRRRELGLTLTDVAATVDVTFSHIAGIETNQTSAAPDTQLLIAESLGGSVDDFFAAVGEPRVAARYEAALTAGTAPTTLQQFAEIWLPDRPGYYEGILRLSVFRVLGRKRLVDLRREDLGSLEIALVDRGSAPGTIRNALMIVKNLHDDAVLCGAIPPDPSGRWACKRSPAQRVKDQEAAVALYANESTIAVARQLGISDSAVRDDLDCRGVARRPRAKGPTPERRECAAGDLCIHRDASGPRSFTPRWPSWGDREHCSPEPGSTAGVGGAG